MHWSLLMLTSDLTKPKHSTIKFALHTYSKSTTLTLTVTFKIQRISAANQNNY